MTDEEQLEALRENTRKINEIHDVLFKQTSDGPEGRSLNQKVEKLHAAIMEAPSDNNKEPPLIDRVNFLVNGAEKANWAARGIIKLIAWTAGIFASVVGAWTAFRSGLG